MNIQPSVHAQPAAQAHLVGMTPASAALLRPPIRRLRSVPTGRSDAAVRRYRIARLRLEDREVAAPSASRTSSARTINTDLSEPVSELPHGQLLRVRLPRS